MTLKKHLKSLENIDDMKTAVDWIFLMLNNPNRDQDFAKKLYDKAKELEKEQSIKDYKAGAAGELWELNINESAESYYNKTYANDTTTGLPTENSKRRGWHY